MESEKNFLKDTLAKESRAYGFTIAFWGSGALLINQSGLPSLTQALLYGFGALAGFGLLTLYVYRKAFERPDTGEESQVLVLSMIHYVGALVPMMAAYYTAKLPSPSNFFLTGLSVSLIYNLGMLVEERLSEKARKLEKKYLN